MIEINLLPKELRKKKAGFKVPDITLVFLPVAAGFIGFLILIQVLLGLAIAAKARAHAQLDREYNQILPQKLEGDAVKKGIKKIQKKVKAIDDLMVKRILWSRKLNHLSDSMIPGIWLTELSLGGKKETIRDIVLSPRKRREAVPDKTRPKTRLVRYLQLEGGASGSYGSETATVGRFIKSLKKNEEFFKYFSKIELAEMQRQRVKDIEVMNFKITCYFKETN